MKKKIFWSLPFIIIGCALLMFQNCSSGGGGGDSGGGTPAAATGTIMFGYDSTNDKLITFRVDAPSVILSSISVTGLNPGEKIIGMDFRPARGSLMAMGAVGATMRMLTINTTTGAVSQLGGALTTPTGTSFGVTFNPVADRIRIVSDGDANQRINPLNGTLVSTDTALSYDVSDIHVGANPQIAGAAYTNQNGTFATTTLYAIDSNQDTLVRIGGDAGTPSPNGGLVFTRGSLGVNTSDQNDLEIDVTSGTAYAALRVGTSSNFYTINTTSGAATLVGTIGDGTAVIDAIAITPPTPTIIYAVVNTATSGRLIAFQSDYAAISAHADFAMSGLGADVIKGIDFRPADGLLYGLAVNGTAARLVTIGLTTAAVTTVASSSFTVSGTNFSFDFNPAADRIRITSDTDMNLRINPTTGMIAATDTTLTYAGGDLNAAANPDINGVGYTNSVSGAATTVYYGIDTGLDILATSASPNGGQLSTVGSLGANAVAPISFDIARINSTEVAYAAMPVAGTTGLYRINLSTGAATQQLSGGSALGIGTTVPGSSPVIDGIAISP